MEGRPVDGVAFDRAQMNALGLLRTGSILCGGVGSGKSRAAIGYFFSKVCGGEIRMNGRGRWKVPSDLRRLIIITTARKRDSGDWEKECVIFGIDEVVVDSWNNISKYVDVSGGFFILDEQRLVGKGTWAKSFLKIASKNDWILLSATPGDTWMDYATVFIANGFYKNRTEFLREHVVYKRFMKYPVVDYYIQEPRLRRLRDQILVEMPVKRHTTRIRENIRVSHDRNRYRELSKRRWNPYEDKPMQNAADYVRVMRRICNEDPDRLVAVRSVFDKHHRIIVFYNFDYELEALRREFSDVLLREWNGHKHEAVPSGDSWVYLVQYTAGAEAWNCITSDCIVFYSYNYSFKITEQAEGRIDRRNTPYTELYYYYLESDSAVDRAIRGSLRAKKVFNERKFAPIFE